MNSCASFWLLCLATSSAQLVGLNRAAPLAFGSSFAGYSQPAVSALQALGARTSFAPSLHSRVPGSLFNAASTLTSRATSLRGQATGLNLQATPGSISRPILRAEATAMNELATKLDRVADEVLEDAITYEDENGLPCCTDMQSAHCASCVLGMSLRDYCDMDDTRKLPGCGFGAPKGQCGVGVISSDGTSCCDPEHCGGKCGGQGCKGMFGGPSHCCATAIRLVGEGCDTHNPPCVIGSGHRDGQRGLYGSALYAKKAKDGNSQKSEAEAEAPAIVRTNHLYFSNDPIYYDDGTEIALDQTCRFHFECMGCARSGCTWDGQACSPFDGVSHGVC